MEMTYETRRRLRRGGVIALVAALILTVVWACWIIWVERHMVYSRDGAMLNFQLTSRDPGEGELAVPPTEGETISIYYNDGSELEEIDTSLRQFTGYYITADMMKEDMDTIRATIAALPVGSGVMLEVKSIRGTYYYTTGIRDADTANNMDIEAVDQLIADIASRNLYLIASLPAFRDRNFGLENPDCGLPYVGGGGALWLDSNNCYWLDPTDRGALSYLGEIIGELKLLGFDEVVFTDFRFPDTDQLDFDGDRVAAIRKAAEKLVDEHATDRFAVSFHISDSTLRSTGQRSRLYLTGVDAAKAAAAAADCTVEDPAVNLVFLTESYDTRFDAWSVLRPMDWAITE